MEKSYSLLGSDHLNLLNHLNEKTGQFDSLHFDLIDENYCGGLGLSIITLEQLSKTEAFNIDVHVLMKNQLDIAKRIENLRIQNIYFQVEHLNFNYFEKLNFQYAKKGLAFSLDTNLEEYKEFIFRSESILLLCMKPSLNSHLKINKALERVKSFQKLFPNYKGKIIVDGGFDQVELPHLKQLKVNTVVIGRTFIK